MILSPPSPSTPSDSYIYRLGRLFVSTPLPRFLPDLLSFSFEATVLEIYGKGLIAQERL